MIFWMIAALMTLVAALSVLRPFMRGKVYDEREANDIDVYRDQLEEVERERASELIGEAEAKEATLEIQRRILASANENRARDKTASGMTRLVALLAVLVVLFVSWGGYSLFGAPDRPDQPLTLRMSGPINPDDAPAMVARIEAHVRENPDDAKGWQVLGPIYLRTGRFDEAEKAFSEVIRIDGESAPLLVALAETQIMREGGRINDAAKANAQKAAELEPRMPKARFMLALADVQDGRTDEAQAKLEAIREDEPEGSEWQQAAVQALADVNARATATAGQAPVLSSEQAGTIAAMPQAEQAQAIAGMVDGLAQKLRDNPRDLQGWQRLIQAYTVLGRNAEAQQALNSGVNAFGQGSSEAANLRRFAREITAGSAVGE
ncbi:c-type cytochrome biogenesis protein CcmI [Limoniibacter endophyticus]|uniref:C-type cytochrome biogenesis protein CcmI n=1 Tax=Limoniibacter endophyticus TaxID=1565040 RepID=A0A8J3DGX7_9HYPH|nr:c-type cytochrome biogenesis protein CcmI [Limoniibacter endophyticus]GHC69262.1 c-type cytochrome biogenesis protein CcmI [Limoniibacter endophyticus]